MRYDKINSLKIIEPYFIVEGKKIDKPIKSMPGVSRISADILLRRLDRQDALKSILLFGIPSKKGKKASSSYSSTGPVQEAVRNVKKEIKDVLIFTDVCVCAYTTHGHCGILKKNKIDNQPTLNVLSEMALSHAEAGSDFVAPSAMARGQVKAIRDKLDREGFNKVGIMAYSAKFASNFYGPFRQAMDSSPKFGDRNEYQLDYTRSGNAMSEIKDDIKEGADIIMVKPALAYLDIIYMSKKRFNTPLAAYSVSGEYSMIKMMAKGNKKIETELAREVITAIRRAGADIIISYFGAKALEWLTEDK